MTVTGMVDVCIRASAPVVVQGTKAISSDHSRFFLLQFFAYLAFVFASALIVLRM